MVGDKLIIIGAGIAGLAAGCYARMNGYDVEIFERHTQPGGMCTSWMRKGLSKTLPGLENFYMVGQWASASIGVSTVALMGRNFLKDLCKKNKKPFVTQ